MSTKIPTCVLCGSLVEVHSTDEGTQSVRSIYENHRPFTWKGISLDTPNAILDAITRVDTRAEAQRFMRTYLLANGYARMNVGYLAGYVSHATADRIYDWFEVVHPFFGRGYPTPREAFAAGLALGTAAKERKDE